MGKDVMPDRKIRAAYKRCKLTESRAMEHPVVGTKRPDVGKGLISGFYVKENELAVRVNFFYPFAYRYTVLCNVLLS
ncbi:hypothetical protein FACS1894200_13090 [Spirochaetia bacterium]|nr:hypothetical protein FACS1894200_13090 [Spirochaetia bacterium]